MRARFSSDHDDRPERDDERRSATSSSASPTTRSPKQRQPRARCPGRATRPPPSRPDRRAPRRVRADRVEARSPPTPPGTRSRARRNRPSVYSDGSTRGAVRRICRHDRLAPAALEKLRRHRRPLDHRPSMRSVLRAERRDRGREVESLGYPALWFSEAWGREAFTNAGLLLANDLVTGRRDGHRQHLGRDAVATANAARTLSAAYDDRFVLGLGVSHEPLVETAARSRLRHAVRGDERVPRRDGPLADVGRRRAQPASPRVIAALGPKMLELAATLADGAHPYLVTPEHTALARAQRRGQVPRRRTGGRARPESRGVSAARPRAPRVLHGTGELPQQLAPAWASATMTSCAAAPSDSATRSSLHGDEEGRARESQRALTPGPITSVFRCWERLRERCRSTNGVDLAPLVTTTAPR